MKLLLACVAGVRLLAAADPPAPIIALFRDMTEELADQDAGSFLDHFDRSMPGFAQLKNDVEGLLAQVTVASTLEFTNDEGDDRHRDLEIDWLWQPSGGPQRRALVKCRVERQGRTWKITRFEPISLFRQ